MCYVASIINEEPSSEDSDPRSYEEAMQPPDSDHWEAAIQDELSSLSKRGVLGDVIEAPEEGQPSEPNGFVSPFLQEG